MLLILIKELRALLLQEASCEVFKFQFHALLHLAQALSLDGLALEQVRVLRFDGGQSRCHGARFFAFSRQRILLPGGLCGQHIRPGFQRGGLFLEAGRPSSREHPARSHSQSQSTQHRDEFPNCHERFPAPQPCSGQKKAASAARVMADEKGRGSCGIFPGPRPAR